MRDLNWCPGDDYSIRLVDKSDDDPRADALLAEMVDRISRVVHEYGFGVRGHGSWRSARAIAAGELETEARAAAARWQRTEPSSNEVSWHLRHTSPVVDGFVAELGCTVRSCIGNPGRPCGVLVAGGPTRCGLCARESAQYDPDCAPRDRRPAVIRNFRLDGAPRGIDQSMLTYDEICHLALCHPSSRPKITYTIDLETRELLPGQRISLFGVEPSIIVDKSDTASVTREG